MGSKTYDGVWFAAYSDDHPPPHVHGVLGRTAVVLEVLYPSRTVRLARRPDRITPPGAKRSDVRRILKVAQEHGAELTALWEAARP